MTHHTRMLLLAGLLISVNAPAAQGPAAATKDDGQWTMPAKNYASTRFSKLDQINADNVKNLQAGWTVATGIPKGHEAAPEKQSGKK